MSGRVCGQPGGRSRGAGLRPPGHPAGPCPSGRRARALRAATLAAPPLAEWLREHGAADQPVELREMDVDGSTLDVTVATEDIASGEPVLRIPDNLIVTLDRVFEDETVAEVLTTDKLSELACLTLYLMYEKMKGEDSEWHAFIKELDRQRARGPLAAESPLLWTPEEVEEYLQGSPAQAAVQERLASMREEYEALDTVWFMSGSLFNRYPYDVPTEAFSFDIFKQAFAAVQATVVHLQNVPLARRFALVPLGPPSLRYSSISKAMIKHDEEANEVTLLADRAYKKGDRVIAWCGPQPNLKLLLNYGIVDENNPYDKLTVTATVPTAGPLFQIKRRLLETANLATKFNFQLQRNKGLPEQLIPFLRICYCEDEAALKEIDVRSAGDITAADEPILQHLALFLQQRLARYKGTKEQIAATLASRDTPSRQRVACRLLVCEKIILHDALDAVMAMPHAPKESALQVTLDECSKFVKLR